MPLTEGLMLVHNALVGAGLRDRIKIGASGKVASGMDIVSRIIQGADFTLSARHDVRDRLHPGAEVQHQHLPGRGRDQDPGLSGSLYVPDRPSGCTTSSAPRSPAAPDVASMGLSEYWRTGPHDAQPSGGRPHRDLTPNSGRAAHAGALLDDLPARAPAGRSTSPPRPNSAGITIRPAAPSLQCRRTRRAPSATTRPGAATDPRPPQPTPAVGGPERGGHQHSPAPVRSRGRREVKSRSTAAAPTTTPIQPATRHRRAGRGIAALSAPSTPTAP